MNQTARMLLAMAGAGMLVACGSQEPHGAPGLPGKGDSAELYYSQTHSARSNSCGAAAEIMLAAQMVPFGIGVQNPWGEASTMLAVTARVNRNCGDVLQLVPSIAPGMVTLTAINTSSQLARCNCNFDLTVQICGLPAGTYQLALRDDPHGAGHPVPQPVTVTVERDLDCPVGREHNPFAQGLADVARLLGVTDNGVCRKLDLLQPAGYSVEEILGDYSVDDSHGYKLTGMPWLRADTGAFDQVSYSLVGAPETLHVAYGSPRRYRWQYGTGATAGHLFFLPKSPVGVFDSSNPTPVAVAAIYIEPVLMRPELGDQHSYVPCQRITDLHQGLLSPGKCYWLDAREKHFCF